jgi:hypothetical protein
MKCSLGAFLPGILDDAPTHDTHEGVRVLRNPDLAEVACCATGL